MIMKSDIHLIDSHCHLDDVRFDEDRLQVLARAAASGIDQIVVPSVIASGWKKLQALCRDHAAVHAAYGLHPWFCSQHQGADLLTLAGLLEQAVAIGECGLDGGKLRATQAQQLHWFAGQLNLAVEYELPVIIHAHKALDMVCREIDRRPMLRGVIHGFRGSAQQADRLLAAGFYVGIGSAISYPRNHRLQQLVRELPAERLLLESDAPDQPPYHYRGQRNEPAFLVEIAGQLATLRHTDISTTVAQCNRNAMELFRL